MNYTSSLGRVSFFHCYKKPEKLTLTSIITIILGVPKTSDKAVKDPQGTVPDPLTFEFSKVKPQQFSGGTAKIVDSTTFKISQTIAAAEVTVEPGAMR